MALKFQPRARMVLICNFRGFEEPEMVKSRPVVVLAWNRRNRHLVTVVPLSTTPPFRPQAWHYRLKESLSPLPSRPVMWAKCDLLYTVSTARLYPIGAAPDHHAALRMAASDYIAVRRAALAWLGIPLTAKLPLDTELKA